MVVPLSNEYEEMSHLMSVEYTNTHRRYDGFGLPTARHCAGDGSDRLIRELESSRIARCSVFKDRGVRVEGSPQPEPPQVRPASISRLGQFPQGPRAPRARKGSRTPVSPRKGRRRCARACVFRPGGPSRRGRREGSRAPCARARRRVRPPVPRGAGRRFGSGRTRR